MPLVFILFQEKSRNLKMFSGLNLKASSYGIKFGLTSMLLYSISRILCLQNYLSEFLQDARVSR